jgi:lipid-A-disaccharide synthase-like uncharacterized protein
MDYFGLFGLVIILAGWLFELAETISKRKTQVPMSFAVLYGAGSLLLTVHSALLGDMVFLILNAFATLIALMNIAFNLLHGKKPKRRK